MMNRYVMTNRMLLLMLATTSTVLFGKVSPLRSQERAAQTLRIGEEVRLTTESYAASDGQYFFGVVGDSLVFYLDESGPAEDSLTSKSGFRLARSSIGLIEARRCCGTSFDGAKRGAILGAITGVAVGAIGVVVGCSTDNIYCHAQGFTFDAILFTLGRGALGMVAGGVAGSFLPPKVWSEVPVGNIPPPLIPARSKVRLTLSIHI